MTTPSATAECSNPACPEFEVEKDMSMMPPDWTDPVWCGGCGDAIPIESAPPPEVEPPVIDNTLPEPEAPAGDGLRWDQIPPEVTYESKG